MVVDLASEASLFTEVDASGTSVGVCVEVEKPVPVKGPYITGPNFLAVTPKSASR